MRTFAIILYVIVLGFLLAASYFVDLFGNDLYGQELSRNYLQYSKVVVPEIEKDLLRGGDQQQILQTWSQIVSEGKNAISIIDYKGKDKSHHVQSVSFTEQTDTINIVAPLSAPKFAGKALLVKYDDSYSDGMLTLYAAGYTAIYILMALMLTVIAWVMYKYISRIGKVAESVAAGSFDLKMPDNRIPALKKLASDINTMADTIEEKTQENLILTGAIHHELRIPITRIRLALDMAVGSSSDAFLTELLTGMDDDLEELSKLMEELLTISRLRLKGVELDKEAVDVPQLIEKVAKDINSEKVELGKITPFELSANHTLLERAIHNIISNAVKYAERQVIVETQVLQNHYQLTIIDDGPGIPQDQRQLVLKPFHRVDKSRNRTTGGFGLGLAIADMVIKDTHAQIEISDSHLGGAAFKIAWPTGHNT